MKRKSVSVDHLADSFGQILRAPMCATREGRVRLLGEAQRDLAAGRMPSPEAVAFLGKALGDWLREGGDLARDHFAVTSRRGDHTTAQALWKRAFITMKDFSESST